MKRYSFILGELKKNDIDREYLAEQLGRGCTYISRRFNGHGSFTMEEAYTMLRLCGLDPADVYRAFPPGGIAPEPQRRPRLRVVGGSYQRTEVAR